MFEMAVTWLTTLGAKKDVEAETAEAAVSPKMNDFIIFIYIYI